jgi:hypothetical protein
MTGVDKKKKVVSEPEAEGLDRRAARHGGMAHL